MHSNVTFQNWIDHLRYLMPPQGVVHIGAGTGASATRYADWSVNTSVLIEAEENYYHKLTQAVSGHKEWSAHTAMVSDKEHEAVYYKASNPNESGSLPPEVMAKLWRNLKTIEERRLITTTLERLLTSAGILPDCLNWLVIDCLPALPILQGAGKYMDGWDMIIARVLLDENLCPGNGAAKIEIDPFLQTQGYRCIAVEEERQPAIANALYIRDWKKIQIKSLEYQERIQQLTHTSDAQTKVAAEREAQIQQLTQARDAQSKLAEERQVQIQQLTQTRDAQTKVAAEQQAQIQQLTQARDAQSKLAEEQQAQIQQLTQARDAQSKLAEERQVQIQQLTQARDAQSKVAEERQVQIQQLIQTRDAQTKLATERQTQLEQAAKAKSDQAKLAAECQQQVEQLTKARDEQAKLDTERRRQLDEMQKRLQQLEGQNAEFASRQTLLQEEVVRAEAQIDLIKDVLLREPGL